jgi:hypothetical protein
MSDLKDKTNEKETKHRGTGGKKVPPQPPYSDDNLETKELSKEDIAKLMEQERKKKMKVELPQADATQPLTAVKMPEPKKEVEEKPIKKLPEPENVDLDLKLQPPPGEPILKKEEKPIPMPPDRLPEMEEEISLHIPEPARAPFSSLTRMLLVVVAVLLIILFYFMFKPREAPQISGKPAGEKEGKVTAAQEPERVTEEIQPAYKDTDVDKTRIKPDEKGKEITLYKLSDEVFQGTAPLKVKEKGPIISEESDPEIAAIGDALRHRVEILHGSKTSTRGGIETKITSGKFHGFMITNTFQQKDDQIISNVTVIVTPLRGRVLIKGNILDSIIRTDYEKLHRELETAGIEVIKTPLIGEGIVNVQLRVTKLYGIPVKPEFLIGSESVGSVELGMPIERIHTVLPPSKYITIEKEILHEDKFYNTYKVCDLQTEPLFFVNAKDNKVWGIQVVSKKYRTAKGIGIGNTLGELRINYLGNTDIKIGETSGKVPFVSIDEVKGIFLLQGEGIDFEMQVFPNDARITYIMIGGSPFIH